MKQEESTASNLADLYVDRQLLVELGKKPERLDLFLKNRLPHVSRNRIQAGIKAQNVLVNKQIKKASYQVQPGDCIDLKLPKPAWEGKIEGEPLPLDIMYEDETLLVVNKAAKMVVHPGCGNWTGTLVNGLLHYFDQTSQPAYLVRAGLVHRLDQGTTGPLVVAKTEPALAYLARQFFNKTVHRRYIALVWGSLPHSAGTIDQPIRRSPGDRRLMATCSSVDPLGKASVTHYEVLERLGYVTLVKCHLETGRTHQIRVHMKHLGCPLFGDSKYGGQQVVKGPVFSKYKRFVTACFDQLPYQALHASELGFIHPTTKKKIFFHAPLPTDFKQVLNKWRGYAEQGTHRLAVY